MGSTSKLLLAALVGASGLLFASGASAQSAGDAKLDDLQSLVAKYDTSHATNALNSGAGADRLAVSTAVRTNDLTNDGASRAFTVSLAAAKHTPAVQTHATTTASHDLRSSLASEALVHAPRPVTSETLSNVAKTAVLTPSFQSLSQVASASHSAITSTAQSTDFRVADVADRKLSQTTVTQLAQQSSTTKTPNGELPDSADLAHSNLATLTPAIKQPAQFVTSATPARNTTSLVEVNPLVNLGLASVAQTVPSKLPSAPAALDRATLAVVRPSNSAALPAPQVLATASNNPVASAVAVNVFEEANVVDSTSSVSTEAATASAPALPIKNPVTAAAVTVAAISNHPKATLAAINDVADRRLKHATEANDADQTKSTADAGDTATSETSTSNLYFNGVSPLAFTPLSSVSTTTSTSLMSSLGSSFGLSGSVTAAVPVFPTPSSSPTGLIVGNGGVVGTSTQLLGSTTNSLFAGGNGYVTNGSLQVNNANFSQGYSIVSVLGIPLLTLNPVGTLLTSATGTLVGGTGVNSHLTLLGGVKSDSYIDDINNGGPNGLLGIALPTGAPAFASTCLNAVLATVACYGINAAQDYQVLVGDGATANGSKEVVIGTNASHTLPLVDANAAFPGSGRNDPNNPTGVPTADYQARLGHSVVVGDDASGSANAQTILGAEATSTAANSVALGYQSSATRGAQSGYTATGLTALQNSAGEVSIGSPGQERQITNVAAGSVATDAVNVAQLQGVIANATGDSVEYDDAGKTIITLAGPLSTDGGVTGGTRITNVQQGALGANSTDAVNGSQLFATNNTVSNIFNTTSKYFQANSTATGSSAIGTDAIAAGPLSVATGNASIALGSGATTADVNGVAIGAGASTTFANSVALGAGSATSVGPQTGYVAFGLAAPQNSAGEISIGSPGQERKITHVAAGSSATDAVNVEQLQGVSSVATNSVQYDNPGKTSITLAGPVSTDGGLTGGTKLSNVQQGVLSATSTDAVNGSQLNATNDTVSNIVNTTSKYFQANSTGTGSSATGTDAIAAGPGSVAAGNASISLGSGAVTGAGNDNAIAIGTNANANFANSIALGNGSATTVGAQAGYIAYGLAAPQTSSGEFNIGNRQLTGLAPGKADSDAVNVEQLKGVSADAANSVQYDNAARTSATLAGVVSSDGGVTNGTTLSNLHQGAVTSTSTDAINGAQFWGATLDPNNPYSNYSLYNDLGGPATASTRKYFHVDSTLDGSTANGANSISVGPNALAASQSSLAMGNGATSQGDFSLAMGDGTMASATDSIAVGTNATASMANSIALGAGSVTTVGARSNYIAYGLAAPQTSVGELAIGNRQITGVAAGSALTDAVNVAQLEAVASQATGGGTSPRSVLYDADVSGNPTNKITLSGDGTGAPVGIANVAAGTETASSTDAVNGSQLYHWTQDASNMYSNYSLYNDIASLGNGGGGSSKYVQVNSTQGGATASGTNSVAIGPVASASGTNSTAIGNGASSTAENSVALGSGSIANRNNTVSVGSVGSERQITNVAAGTSDTDAANVGQLNSGVQQAENWASSYTDQRVGALSNQIQQIGNRANAGVAAAMAMAGLPQAYEPGKSMVAAAAGTFRSESSLAIGISTISEGGRWVYKMTGSVDTRGDGGFSIGAGMQW